MKRTRIEPLPSPEVAVSLLAACGLPVSDIPRATRAKFFGIHLDGTLAAVVGVERYPPFWLLRSLAVAPAYLGVASRRSWPRLPSRSLPRRAWRIYSCSAASAAEYFLRLGYSSATRDAAPPAIRAASRFTVLCPASSAFLSIHITRAA